MELALDAPAGAARPGLARLLARLPPRPPAALQAVPAPEPAAAAAAPGEGRPGEPAPAPRPPPAALLAAAVVEEGAPLAAVPLAPPLRPLVVASPFGARASPFTGLPSRHEGVDLLAPPGSRVLAAAAGRVLRAGWSGSFGLAVEIDHGRGVTTRYAHLARVLVRPGAAVGEGQPVGLVGSSGRSTGPHLHYEVRLAGEAVDPLPFLEAGRLLAAARAGRPAERLDDGPIEAYDPNALGGEADPPT